MATIPRIVEVGRMILDFTVSVSIPANVCCRLSSFTKLPLCPSCDFSFCSTLISAMPQTGQAPSELLLTLGCNCVPFQSCYIPETKVSIIAIPEIKYVSLFVSSATIFSCLNWWTFNCPVAAINTTVALYWLQSGFTLFTFVEIHTGICRHNFSFLVSAVWAGQS